MHIQKNSVTPATSQNYIWHPIAKNFTLLTADIIEWCTKILFPNDDFLFIFHRKNSNPLS